MVNTDFYTVVMNQSNEGIFRILKQRSDKIIYNFNSEVKKRQGKIYT